MVKKFYLERMEFYITNVCNYNCSNCNRLNNFYFSGHQLWKDYCDVYKAWSEKLDIKEIAILGGEPFLNPSLSEWVSGLRTYWPDSTIVVLTNGSRLDKFDNLYKLLVEHNISLSVQTHNRALFKKFDELIRTILQGKITVSYAGSLDHWPEIYKSISAPSWPTCTSAADFKNLPQYIQDECTNIHKIDPESYLYNSNGHTLTDANGVSVQLAYAEEFVSAPLNFDGRQKLTVYNSDKDRAHDACISKYCYHFIRGKLYKCHHVGLLPEFIEQFYVDISDEDIELLKSYQPLEVTDSDTVTENFIKNLRNSMPQCKLCPETLTTFLLSSTIEKPKLKKILKILDIKSIL